MSTQTRPAHLELACPSIGFEASPTGTGKQFAGVAYSGGEFSSYGRGVIDLASTTVAKRKIPTLKQHKQDCVLGHCELTVTGSDIRVSGGKLYSNEEAARLASDVSDGYEPEFSVGLYGFSWEDVPPGVDVTVNGRNFSGPIAVLRNGVVRELSVVALGADPNTSSAFFSQSQTEDHTMDLAQANAKIAELTAENAALKAQVKTAEDAAAAAKDELSASQEAAKKAAAEARETAIKADLAAAGIEYTEDVAKPFRELSAEGYAAVMAQLKARAPGDARFFREEATGGQQERKPEQADLEALDPFSIYERRAKERAAA